MPQKSNALNHLLALFNEKPCWTIVQLAAELHYSIPSIRRFLVQLGYISSFSHNGKWYTLLSIPRFNRDGLWFHDGISFSRAGSLTNTLIVLTTHSPAGMTAEQLSAKLQRRCHSILVQLCRSGKLQRRKIGRSHVYFAGDPHTAALQQQAMPPKDVSEAQLPSEITIFILAEFIRKPGSSFDQLAETISRRGNIIVKAAQIEKLFAQLACKKTP